MTTATASAPLALIFRTNDALVTRALSGVSDDDLWRRLTDNNNPLLWVVGHAVETRTFLLAQLGEPFATGWGELFRRGSALSPANAYPGREQVESVAATVATRMQDALARLDGERLEAPASVPGLPQITNVGEAVAFFALHDSYHVGQIAFIRKGLGYSQLVG